MLKLRHPLSLLIISLLVMLGVLRSYDTPAPVGADAADVVFSAVRAQAILEGLLKEGKPHVTGSEQNRIVRDRVAEHFRASGYDPQMQSRFHCNPAFGSCSPVDNIIAVKPGSRDGGAVLLTTHYDSSWTGPGASDSGAGVAAILEIARMAADFPPFANDIIFLITDSEENGLIGADAFVRHNPLFAKVKAVINLEARGVTGPSMMFETGHGNRSIIRLYAKNIERPSANSLVYEIYKTLPNDTDYSVYRAAGVQGLNFAFANGVAAYHSVVDDVPHMDLGSLQHHGDNAWAMLKALGERELRKLDSRENAGYIDVFGMTISHYPESITGGLAIFLGVWVMLAITLAFRKEFRYRQLRWGLVAIPLMAVLLVAGGYLLSFPLGRWLDIHPLEHPLPWAARLVLFTWFALVLYLLLKLFSGKVSACAWMILGWFLIFALALYLANNHPAVSHIALLPLAMFAIGSLVDIFRKKSPAPLLFASVLGFATTAFISLQHFFLFDGVANFGFSHARMAVLVLMALAVMPMLLAYVKDLELGWKPARWLLVALAAFTVLHLFLPGFTPERPRDMTLMYREVAGESSGYVVLESLHGHHDKSYARSHDFESVEIDNGRLGLTERPVRSVKAIGLPQIEFQQIAQDGGAGNRYELVFDVPFDTPYMRLALPEDLLNRAWVNGELAVDPELERKRDGRIDSIRLVHPGRGQIRVVLETTASAPFTVAAVTWHDLPSVLVAPFMGNWPDEAQPYHYGPRAELIQRFEIDQNAAGAD
jgi:hypothetical protein